METLIRLAPPYGIQNHIGISLSGKKVDPLIDCECGEVDPIGIVEAVVAAHVI